MIVSIGLGEDGINVCLDDEIDSYDPLRTVELCREARRLFAGAYLDWTGTPLSSERDVPEVEG